LRQAREINPKIRILTSCNAAARGSGAIAYLAQTEFSSEGEIALSIADFLMESLGATDEQILEYCCPAFPATYSGWSGKLLSICRISSGQEKPK
jgi:hypothetical protein